MLRYFPPIFLPYDVCSYNGKWKVLLSRKPMPPFPKFTCPSSAAAASHGLNLRAEAGSFPAHPPAHLNLWQLAALKGPP